MYRQCSLYILEVICVQYSHDTSLPSDDKFLENLLTFHRHINISFVLCSKPKGDLLRDARELSEWYNTGLVWYGLVHGSMLLHTLHD